MKNKTLASIHDSAIRADTLICLVTSTSNYPTYLFHFHQSA